MGVIGEQIGNYAVIERLGAGGMGEVYIAEHVLLGSKAVVKVLLPQYSVDQDLIKRFFNEAKATTAIKHPGMVQVFDFGVHTPSESAYLVMELLEGETLRARLIRDKRLAPDGAMVIARQIASTLDAAHAKGIVHRDLKPENIFLVADPEVPGGQRAKILDFGIAKLNEKVTTKQTQVGALLGTPQYMSPEQCESASSVDGRTDIYALGCMLYEMVVGVAPFRGETFGETITAHLFQDIPVASTTTAVPAGFDDVVTRALAKDAAMRQPTMAAVAVELDAVLRGDVPMTAPQRALNRRSRVPLFGVAAVVVAAAAVGVVYANRSSEPSGAVAVAAPAGSDKPKTATVAPTDEPHRAPTPGTRATSPATNTRGAVVPSPNDPTNARANDRANGVSPTVTDRQTAAVPSAPAVASGHRNAPSPKPHVADVAANPVTTSKGMLDIATKPACEVIVDGTATGQTTPVSKMSLSAGKHVVVLVDRADNIRETVVVVVEAGRSVQVSRDWSDRLDPNKRTFNPYPEQK